MAAPGSYDVYMWHPAASSYANNVPVDIAHAGGTATVVVNQRTGGGTWKKLGTWSFNAGTSGFVKIRTAGTSGPVIADAVKFVPTGGPAPAETHEDGTLLLLADDATAESAWPLVWAPESDMPECRAAHLVDGDTNTVWTAPLPEDGYWQILIDLGMVFDLTAVDIHFAESNTCSYSVVGSEDSQTWQGLTDIPGSLRYLGVNLWPEDASDVPPVIGEILWGTE